VRPAWKNAQDDRLRSQNCQVLCHAQDIKAWIISSASSTAQILGSRCEKWLLRYPTDVYSYEQARLQREERMSPLSSMKKSSRPRYKPSSRTRYGLVHEK